MHARPRRRCGRLIVPPPWWASVRSWHQMRLRAVAAGSVRSPPDASGATPIGMFPSSGGGDSVSGSIVGVREDDAAGWNKDHHRKPVFIAADGKTTRRTKAVADAVEAPSEPPPGRVNTATYIQRLLIPVFGVMSCLHCVHTLVTASLTGPLSLRV
jgi:hypothetical protein